MASMDQTFMPLRRQLFGRTIAESLAELLGQKYRSAKQLARAADIDPSTAENLRKGHLSVTTLQKLLSVEGPDLWDRLGEELFGETYEARQERKLSLQIREAEDARSNLVRLRARREELLSSAHGLDGNGHRSGADADRGTEARTWTADDRERPKAARGGRPDRSD